MSKMAEDEESTVATEETASDITITAMEETPTKAVYAHTLDLSSADLRRRQKEIEIAREEEARLKKLKEIQRRQKEEEMKRDMEMLINYNPWGKPGGGAPTEGTRRRKFTDLESSVDSASPVDDHELQNALPFNTRPGGGAPNRTKSGRLITHLRGDPELRFKDVQQVQLSIQNSLRYKNQDKEGYRHELDNIIKMKKEAKEKEKQEEQKLLEEMERLYPFGRHDADGNIVNGSSRRRKPTSEEPSETSEETYDPWGKGYGNPLRDELGRPRRHRKIDSLLYNDASSENADLGLGLPIGLGTGGGNGAPLVTKSGNVRTRLRNGVSSNASSESQSNEDIEEYFPWGQRDNPRERRQKDGKSFLEKMGWSTGDEGLKSKEAKHEYLETLKKEMEEKYKKKKEEKRHVSSAGQELASLMSEKVVGKPKRDPQTGELLRNVRPISDVTAYKSDFRRYVGPEADEYFQFLHQQSEQKEQEKQKEKDQEKQATEQHLETWNTFWGRPGNGAPRETTDHKKVDINFLLENAGDKAGQPYVKKYTREIIPSKHNNFFEVPPKEEANVIKTEYEFKTPYPQMT